MLSPSNEDEHGLSGPIITLLVWSLPFSLPLPPFSRSRHIFLMEAVRVIDLSLLPRYESSPEALCSPATAFLHT
ncbi:hypothetical protein HanRHA438_Chr01g0030951 [Helianthus annuus]|nr:hypothetical protein HanRHA438_Chr01g0030951 [Helianthus annuus]